MTLTDKIMRAISLKPGLKSGNQEFALFFLPDCGWRAEIGNDCAHVLLGEIDGEFRAEGPTPDEAVEKLISILETARAGTPAERKL